MFTSQLKAETFCVQIFFRIKNFSRNIFAEFFSIKSQDLQSSQQLTHFSDRRVTSGKDLLTIGRSQNLTNFECVFANKKIRLPCSFAERVFAESVFSPHFQTLSSLACLLPSVQYLLTRRDMKTKVD